MISWKWHKSDLPGRPVFTDVLGKLSVLSYPQEPKEQNTDSVQRATWIITIKYTGFK